MTGEMFYLVWKQLALVCYDVRCRSNRRDHDPISEETGDLLASCPEQTLLPLDTGCLGIIPRCKTRDIVNKTVNPHRGISPLLLPKLNSPYIVTKNET